jgi:hypothetical protein
LGLVAPLGIGDFVAIKHLNWNDLDLSPVPYFA